jgi:hypothetical protein
MAPGVNGVSGIWPGLVPGLFFSAAAQPAMSRPMNTQNASEPTAASQNAGLASTLDRSGAHSCCPLRVVAVERPSPLAWLAPLRLP